MDRIDLATSLDRPLCSRCKTAHIRPIGINGTYLTLDCPRCRWRPRAELPAIQKKIVYLDTSTVSNIASAKRTGKTSSKWLLLYEALRESAAENVICCVCSSIVQREAELSRHATEIVAMSREFGDPHARHELDVRHAQLLRALDRFLWGAGPTAETSLSWKDAFNDDPHRWQESFSFNVDARYSPALVESLRTTKSGLHQEVTRIYASYATNGLRFDEISKLEEKGFGQGIIADGWRAIEYRMSPVPTEPDETKFGMLLPTSFDLVVHQVKEKTGLEYADAVAKSVEFLSSEHTSSIPVAQIGSRLHAAIAMTARGSKARHLSPSDAEDIAHVAVFMPYVSILIADRYIESLCNRNDVRLGDSYDTKIRCLGERDIDVFTDELRQLRAECSYAAVSRQIQRSIVEGGYMRERTEALKQWLKRMGADVPSHVAPPSVTTDTP